jgi:hypothetical protein
LSGDEFITELTKVHALYDHFDAGHVLLWGLSTENDTFGVPNQSAIL